MELGKKLHRVDMDKQVTGEESPTTTSSNEGGTTPGANSERQHTAHQSESHKKWVMDRYKTTTQPRSFATSFGKMDVRFNPVVSAASIVLIWGFVIVAIYFGGKMEHAMFQVKKWIRSHWTWLYIGSYNVWAIFVLVICASKYSAIKLGQDHEHPEFSDVSYFTMLFAAGIGPGLFYFAVAEPIHHYTSANRYTIRGLTDNENAQYAMDLTFFHWGIHAWCVYVLIGMLLALMSYRYNLNMTVRSCFFPLLGERVQGCLGDLIDIFSVVCTMFGVCTTLGLGVIQLNRGFARLFPKAISFGHTAQIVLIWVITGMATLSVVSGMKKGIKLLSEICFVIGIMLMLTIFFYDDTFFILNATVQNIGSYLSNIAMIGLTTDSFAQLNNSMDGKDVPAWMDDWTIFYWGWWVSWSPFVGMFIAKISRGRTIRDFIFYTLTVPCVYILIWFSVFGSVSIKMEREAYHLGLGCLNVTEIINGTAETFMQEVTNGRIYRLSCRETSEMLFDVVDQYEGLTSVLSVVSMVSLVLYFVTSSDSGSMIIDCLTANGIEEPPMLQRIFWSVTEGACATALLIAGGQEALQSLRTVSVSAGLIYTMVLNLMCLALWRSLRIEAGEISPLTPSFVSDLVTPFYQAPKSRRLLMALFAPFWPLSRVAASVYSEEVMGPSMRLKKRVPYAIVMGVPFVAWILLLVFSTLNGGLMYVGWTFYVAFIVYATGIRASLREEYSIVGNILEDFFTILFLYPLAVMQMDEQMTCIDHTQHTMTVPAAEASWKRGIDRRWRYGVRQQEGTHEVSFALAGLSTEAERKRHQVLSEQVTARSDESDKD